MSQCLSNAVERECFFKANIRQKSPTRLQLEEFIRYGKDVNQQDQYLYVVNNDPVYYADVVIIYEFGETYISEPLVLAPMSSHYISFRKAGSNPRVLIGYVGIGRPIEYTFRLYNDAITCISATSWEASYINCETLKLG